VDTDDRRTQIRARLDADAWLGTGDLAVLFDTSRTSVHRWLTTGVVVDGVRRYPEYRLTGGGHRLIDPAFVRLLLAKTEQRRSATTDPDTGDDTSDG